MCDNGKESRITVKQTKMDSKCRLAAGAGCDAEPPLFPPCPSDVHRLRLQPDHPGPGRGHAPQPARRRRGPAAVRHENLPQPAAGPVTRCCSPIFSSSYSATFRQLLPTDSLCFLNSPSVFPGAEELSAGPL